MKRLILCAVAALLASGALVSRPAYACTMDPICVDEGCDGVCANGGACNTCTGRCRCF
ncbi:MAG TPA: hypothetical protein VGG20_15350 [Thermoanaerobaculia bacterium]